MSERRVRAMRRVRKVRTDVLAHQLADTLDTLRRVRGSSDEWWRLYSEQLAEVERLRAERLAFTSRLGYGDGVTGPAADLDQLVEDVEVAFEAQSEHFECPAWCPLCGEKLASVPCEACGGSGDAGSILGAAECGECGGVGKTHPHCPGVSVVDLAADRDAARAELAGLRERVEGLRALSDAASRGPWSFANAARALLTPAETGQGEGRAADAHEREMIEVITERDALHDVADALAAAIAPAEVLGEHSSANCPWQNALDYAAERRPTPPSDDLRERVAEVIEAALWLIGEAWDDGNAAGLDGWTGPGRGAGEVDREAQHARTRMVHKADAALTVLAGREGDR